MGETISALIIEDSADDAALLVYELGKEGYEVRHKRVDTAAATRQALGSEPWDIILCDYTIPDFGALPALALARELKADLPFIVVSGVVGEETAVSVMQAGARDFIVKGAYTRLLPAVRREIEEYRRRKKNEEEAKKQAEEAEKQRQLAFTMAMQNPQPLLIVNRKFNVKLANQSFLTISGYSENQLQKMNLKEFKILAKSGQNMREALETKKGVTGQVTVEFPTGVRTFEQHSIPLLDKQGEIVSFMAVYNDLTAKLADDARKKELADSTSAYLQTLGKNLEKLAAGDIGINLELAPATAATAEARKSFAAINANLSGAKDALMRLTADADMISTAAVEGRLATRADASKHHGDYRKIVEGVNNTLDCVINPVNEAMRVSNEYAKQNFAARVDEKLKVAGDFIRFKQALNNIGIAVSKAVEQVNKQTMDLAAASQEAAASIQEVTAGAGQIAQNAGKVNENADKSSQSMAQVLKAMEDLSTAVERVTSSMESVSDQAKQADEASREGAVLAENVEKGMAAISKSTESVHGIVGDIEKQMADISKIVNLIRDLANQTNLLALNAAIEAARAGDAGRGFAVVAAEVKSLAGESRSSAEKIEGMITNLNKSTTSAAAATGEAKTHVTKGAQMSSQALAAFRKIKDVAVKVSSAATEVAAAAEEQAATVEEITASVHEVQKQIEGTAKEASNAAAATEQATASINEVSRVVENVNKIAENVSKEMAKFTTT